jgi:hypothetical protein
MLLSLALEYAVKKARKASGIEIKWDTSTAGQW